MADALDLGSSPVRGGGSSPLRRSTQSCSFVLGSVRSRGRMQYGPISTRAHVQPFCWLRFSCSARRGARSWRSLTVSVHGPISCRIGPVPPRIMFSVLRIRRRTASRPGEREHRGGPREYRRATTLRRPDNSDHAPDRGCSGYHHRDRRLDTVAAGVRGWGEGVH